MLERIEKECGCGMVIHNKTMDFAHGYSSEIFLGFLSSIPYDESDNAHVSIPSSPS